MNRPPKKSGQPETPPSPASPDERNLVNVDDAFQEADIDDRLWLWWQKNGRTLLYGLAAVALVIIGREVYQFSRERAVETMQDRFLKAAAAENETPLKDFGKANSDEPLGAFALLKAANAIYAEGEYSNAAMAYATAAEALETAPVLRSRARIGQGMALVDAGDAERGLAILERVARDDTVLASLRAEAAFRLAMTAMNNGDAAKAGSWLGEILAINPGQQWERQVNLLLELDPDLSVQPAAAPPTIDLPLPVEAPTPGATDAAQSGS